MSKPLAELKAAAADHAGDPRALVPYLIAAIEDLEERTGDTKAKLAPRRKTMQARPGKKL